MDNSASANSHPSRELINVDQLTELKVKLTQQIRMLHSKISALKQANKEDQIQYNLLIQRGYQSSDTACASILQRQEKRNSEIQQLNSNAKDAEGLRQRLITSVNNLDHPQSSIGVDASLRQEVLKLIHRASLDSTPNPIIPDTVWASSADAGKIKDFGIE